MAVTRDLTKPLHEEEPYLVQNKARVTASQIQTSTDWYGNPITEPDRSNPSRNRYESPLQTIMSFEYSIAREEYEYLATRPGTAIANFPNSTIQPSQRTSSFSANNMQTPQPSRERHDYRQDSRDRYNPPREQVDPRNEWQQYRAESNGETSSAASSYNHYHPMQPAPVSSPPSTPKIQKIHFPQSTTTQQVYGQRALPSPEPEADAYPTVPVKQPNAFVTRPVTPPSDLESPREKKSRLDKLKRLSGLGKSGKFQV